MNYPYKIVFIHQDGLITGSLLSLIQMIKGFDRDQISATVILLKEGPAYTKLADLGIPTLVHKGRTFWTTPGPKFLQKASIDNLLALIPDIKLRKVIAGLKPDLVHINDKAGINAGISLLGSGIPVVQHLRSTYYISASLIHKIISILVIKLTSKHCIAISEAESIGFNKNNTSIIYNSIQHQEIENAISGRIAFNSGKIHIGWVGQFTYQKGAWDFLELAAKILQQKESIHFHLLAALPNEKQSTTINNRIYQTKGYLDELIKEYNLTNSITLHGYRVDYLKVMASMDLMVCCNRLGTTGRQAFESICLGIPMIGTAKFPLQNSIHQLGLGLIVKEGDAAQLLRTTLSLIENTEARAKLKADALQRGRSEFNSVTQSTKVIKVYQKILS